VRTARMGPQEQKSGNQGQGGNQGFKQVCDKEYHRQAEKVTCKN